MKKNIAILLLCLLSSCVSTNYISIDVREPAIITFPPEVVNVTILNNVSTKNIEEIEIKRATDSLNNFLIHRLTEYIEGEKYFGKISIYTENRKKNGDNISQQEIRNICSTNISDALIVLYNFDIRGSQTQTDEDPRFHILEMGTDAKLKVYNSSGIFMPPNIDFVDTFYWNGYVLDEINYRSLPTPEDALKQTIELTADALTQQLIPHWQPQGRWYYADNSGEMKATSKLVQENKWQEAMAIWERLYKAETKQTRRIRLASNIALAYECLDNIDKAIEWTQIAIKMLPGSSNSILNTEIANYKKILDNRMEQRKKLRDQV